MTKYALIDNASGYIWGQTDAADPIAACRKVDIEIAPSEVREYEIVFDLASNETGYHVYQIDRELDIDDGTDEGLIAAVEKCERVAIVRVTRADA